MICIALCSDNKSFSDNRLRDKNWSNKFPGSGWLTCLYDLAANEGFDISSGEIAIQKISTGEWDPCHTLIIQEMDAQDGARLKRMGALPFLVYCFEAALYAFDFYDNSAKICHDFKIRLGFGLRNSNLGQFHGYARFPTYFADDVTNKEHILKKNRYVIVASNKYQGKKLYVPHRITLKNIIRQIKRLYHRKKSNAYKNAVSESLLDERLKIVQHFAENELIDIYGSGWDALDDLPSNVSTNFKRIISNWYMGICESKIDILDKYKFSICFENSAQPGYVTEKIVDCFIAGTIPIYFGAPDINNIIPNSAYIDVRRFSTLENLTHYINGLKEVDVNLIKSAGITYLKSSQGSLHCHDIFAKYVINEIFNAKYVRYNN
jgi:hypothetical protein